MPINKAHIEFTSIDMGSDGWHVPEGYPEGIEQSQHLRLGRDDLRRRGDRRRPRAPSLRHDRVGG